MKISFILFLIFQQISFLIPLTDKVSFYNYQIENFSQDVQISENQEVVRININFFYKKLPYVSRGFLSLKKGEKRELNDIVLKIYNSSESYTDYVKNVLLFLKTNIKYSKKNQPQDLVSVLRRGSGYCTGFTNLSYYLLIKGGVRVKKITGFYFYKKKNLLQKHSWIEVFFPSYGWFAIDPITGKFSNYYIYGKIEKDFIFLKNFSVSFNIQN